MVYLIHGTEYTGGGIPNTHYRADRVCYILLTIQADRRWYILHTTQSRQQVHISLTHGTVRTRGGIPDTVNRADSRLHNLHVVQSRQEVIIPNFMHSTGIEQTGHTLHTVQIKQERYTVPYTRGAKRAGV